MCNAIRSDNLSPLRPSEAARLRIGENVLADLILKTKDEPGPSLEQLSDHVDPGLAVTVDAILDEHDAGLAAQAIKVRRPGFAVIRSARAPTARTTHVATSG